MADHHHDHHHRHDHHGQDHAGHHHHGGHGHSHAPADFGRAFAIGIVLNLGFVLVEGAYGFIVGSMALLADAGHNMSDVLSLLIAWGASVLTRRGPSRRYTYGFKSSSILAAILNAVLLLAAIGIIAGEAVRRFAEPAAVPGTTVMIVAGIGVLVNGFTAFLFMGGRKGDVNVRGAYLHMASDAVVSLGVVAAGFAIQMTGALWIDPATSLLIVAVIALGSWGLLRESVDMALQAVPAGLDAQELEAFLHAQPGVTAIHDLHVWSMSTTEVALTVHLLIPDGFPGDAYLAGIASELSARFGIGHATIQIETDADMACALSPAHVV